MHEGRALVLAHDPLFTVAAHGSDTFHPASAAGKAAAHLGISSSFDFKDPHHGKGGFGGSGAEFLSVFAAGQGNSFQATPGQAWQAFDLYRQLGCAGSGADILTQGCGAKNSLVKIDIPARTLEILPTRLGLTVTLFHTGVKLDTHAHLGKGPEPYTPVLARFTEQAIRAHAQGDSPLFLQCLADFAAALESQGLLAAHSARALRALPPGIFGKGCGAMGSDVLAVVHPQKPDLTAWAAQHSLVECASLPI